jgi:hypothetical protein
MFDAIRELLKSKKFLVALAGMIAAALARAGWDISNETILAILTPLISFVIGQGISDFGKSAASIRASSGNGE